MSTRELRGDMVGEVDLARLRARVTVTATGCWEWTRGRNEYGYGMLRLSGQTRATRRLDRAHRIAYAALVGTVPAGVNVLHRCDNPPCCNPAHLFLGTAKDNTADMWAKGRGYVPPAPRGQRCGTAKLTDAQVESAIVRLLKGETRASVARSFGVDLSTISKIATGRNWAHLTTGRGITKSTRGTKRHV